MRIVTKTITLCLSISCTATSFACDFQAIMVEMTLKEICRSQAIKSKVDLNQIAPVVPGVSAGTSLSKEENRNPFLQTEDMGSLTDSPSETMGVVNELSARHLSQVKESKDLEERGLLKSPK